MCPMYITQIYHTEASLAFFLKFKVGHIQRTSCSQHSHYRICLNKTYLIEVCEKNEIENIGKMTTVVKAKR